MAGELRGLYTEKSLRVLLKKSQRVETQSGTLSATWVVQMTLAFLSPECTHTGRTGSKGIYDKSRLATVASAEIAGLNLLLYQSLSSGSCIPLPLSLLMLFTVVAISNT